MVKDFGEWGKRGGKSKGFGKGFWREREEEGAVDTEKRDMVTHLEGGICQGLVKVK